MKLVLIVLVLSACSPVSQTPPRVIAEPEPVVQLLSSRMEEVTDENSAIHGEVRNSSNVEIDLLKITAAVYDGQGIRTTGWTLAEKKPLAPAATSTFTVWVSGTGRYKLEFADKHDKPIKTIQPSRP